MADDERDRFPDAPRGSDQDTDLPDESTDREPIGPLPGVAGSGNPSGARPDDDSGIPTGPPDPTVGPD